MKMAVGVWIDHRKAVIVAVSKAGEETRVIESGVDKQPGRLAGVRSTSPYEPQHVMADDSRQRKFTGQLDAYYDEVVSSIRDADSILILGPGEAKGELTKCFEKHNLGHCIVAVESVDKMTDRQIAAKVRKYFHA
jgi:stalled ribosome rescue protein Dom34